MTHPWLANVATKPRRQSAAVLPIRPPVKRHKPTVGKGLPLSLAFLEMVLRLEQGVVNEAEFAEACLAVAGRKNRRVEVR